jgi:hypothetical protein
MQLSCISEEGMMYDASSISPSSNGDESIELAREIRNFREVTQ